MVVKDLHKITSVRPTLPKIELTERQTEKHFLENIEKIKLKPNEV